MNIAQRLIKKFDDEDIIKFSDKNVFSEHSAWVPSGSPTLDKNLGTLGMPAGLSLIAGDSGSGKTTLCLHLLKNFQIKYPDGLAMILSSEARDNKIYAQKIGVKTEDVLIIKNRFLEDLFFKFQVHINEVKKIWKEDKLPGKPKIFAMWDSIGGTLSRAEQTAYEESVDIMQKNIEQKKTTDANVNPKMMAFQKEAKRLIKGLISQLYDVDLFFVAIAHTGDSTNGRGKVVYGGTWQEFFSTIRLETVVVQKERLDEVEVAQYTKVKVLKNDFGSRKPTVLEILMGVGVVLSLEDIDYAIEKGIIKADSVKKRSFMGDKLKWSTKREFYQNYIDGNKLLPVLHSKIQKAMHKDILESKGIKLKNEE